MPSEQVTGQIAEFLGRAFQGRTIGPGDDIFALGFGNSLFAMQLVSFVERQFSIAIESEDLEMANFRSIDAIASLVERKRARGH